MRWRETVSLLVGIRKSLTFPLPITAQSNFSFASHIFFYFEFCAVEPDTECKREWL